MRKRGWHPIPGYPGYFAHRSGKIAGTAKGWRVLRTYPDKGGYPRIQPSIPSGKVMAYVHILICRTFHGPAPRSKPLVDHRNNKRGDPRARNLRWSARGHNNAHKAKHKGKCRYKGVSRCPQTGRYFSYCGASHLGRFDTQRQAAKAYDKAAKKRWGEFAVLNFPRARR